MATITSEEKNQTRSKRLMAVTKKLLTGRRHTAPTNPDAAGEITRGDTDPPVRFDNELAYALSNVRYIREHAPAAPMLSDIQRKHLNPLDGIALLLVTEQTSDVAAVSLLQSSTSSEFYYAKNRPSTASEAEYVEALLKLARNHDPSKKSEYIRNTADMATRMCVRKLRHRIRKLSLELAKSGITASLSADNLNDLPIWQTTGNEEGAIGNAIANAYALLKSTSKDQLFQNSDKTLLAYYFLFALEMDVSIEDLRKDSQGVLQLVVLSYQVGGALREDPIVSNSTLVRRIQKLGDYFGAVLSIEEALASFKLRTAIRFIEVKPPQPAAYPLPTNFLRIINSYADSRGTRHIEWEELIDAYPTLRNKAKPAEGEVTSVTTSVHCECTVAVHMLQKVSEYANKGTRPSSVDIGISKHSCWFCQKYLEFVLQSTWGMRFVVTGYQGKIQAGWVPPLHGPPSAHNNIVGLLKHEIDEILESVERKRRSDSFPRELGPDAGKTELDVFEENAPIRLKGFKP